MTDNTSTVLTSVDTDTLEEAGKKDRSGEIRRLLETTGYCRLGEGIFYVSGGIDMPDHAMLEGCGEKTELRLLASVKDGYVLKLRAFNTVQNLCISGAKEPIYESFTDTIGTRHGIEFIGNDDEKEGESVYRTEHCMINSVWIRNFTGSGILCHNSSITFSKGLYVSQAMLFGCHTGINIDYRSEFNKFVNCCMAYCYYGTVNNGGNNAYANCTFHARKIGFFIDNSKGDKWNNAHGLCTGGTFCHIGKNEGSAITIVGVKHGYVFSSCQIHYNSVDLIDSSGIQFSAIQFGKGVGGRKGATINITGGGTVLFNGCMFMSDDIRYPEITVRNNDKVKFINCFGSATGNPITAESRAEGAK